MKKCKPNELIDKSVAANSELMLVRAEGNAAKWRTKYTEMANLAMLAEKKLSALLEITTSKPIKRLSKYSKLRSSKRGVAVVVPATDWHIGEEVTEAGTNCKNWFNLNEAERRVSRFYEKILELIDWQNHLAPVVELWHPLLGDLMSGYIHEELVESNSLSPTEACIILRDMINAGLSLLLKKTKLQIYIPTCIGNHGRTTQKMRIKTSYKNSYEWLLYMTMAQQQLNRSRISWRVGRGYHNIQGIMGRRIRFHHGDGIRYQGGVGGISIPVNKAIAQWDKSTAVDFDVFGHYHQFTWGYNKWISCGALIGWDEFALKIKAEFQHPSQTFIVVDRNYGVTSAMPIFLTKPGAQK